MNIKRVAIIKGTNPETNKKEIERIVIFYDNGSVEVQEYERVEHLRLVAEFLNGHGLDILNDGLVEGMRNGLISVVSREDEIAMQALNSDILEANILNANKEEERVNVEAPRVELSDEFKDLARYLRLSILRNNGQLPQEGLDEIDEIVARNERAAAIEETRNQLLAGNCEVEDYERVVAFHRAALAEAIKNVKLNQNRNNDVEEAPVVEEEKQERATISDEFKDLARYLRLNMLRENKVLPPVGLAELEEIVARNERAQAIEETRNQYLAGNRVTKEGYEKVLSLHRAALADEIKRVAELNRNAETVRTVEPVEEEVKAEELSDEYKELVKYFRKNILRNRGVLPPAGLAEIEELAKKNERVAAMEEARARFLADELSEENYERVIEEHRRALSEEAKRVAEVNRQRGIVTPVEVTEPNYEEPAAEEEYDNNRDNFEMPEENRIPEGEEFDNHSDEEVKEPINRIPADYTEGNNNEDLGDNNNVIPVPPMPKNDKDGNDGKGGDDPSAPVIPVAPVNPTENDGEGAADPEDEEEKENEDDKDKQPTQIGGLPIVINRNQPEGTTDRKIPEDPEEIEEEEIEVPIPVEGTVSEDEPKKTAKVKVKKRGRVLAWLGGILLGLLAIIPGGAWLIDKLNGNKDGGKTLPPATENPEATPTAPVQDNTISEDTYIQNALISYANEMGFPQTTMNFMMRGDVQEFLKGFKDPAQLRMVMNALAFGYEMNMLTNPDGSLKTNPDGSPAIKSFTYDYMCAKAYVNCSTPDEMRAIFGSKVPTVDELEVGYQHFYNMLTVYGINGTTIPPFRYLFDGETQDAKALCELFGSLAIVNSHRKDNTLTTEHTDNFIVTVDRLQGRGGGNQFTTYGADRLSLAIIDAYCYGQCNVAGGAALTLQQDHGVSKAGLTLSPDEDGRWEKDGYNYNDLYTQANRRWGSMEDYNSRCYKYTQKLSDNLEQARRLVAGDTLDARLDFADAIDDTEELKGYAEQIRRGTYTQETLSAISAVIYSKYPDLSDEYATFVSSTASTNGNADLRTLEEWAPEADKLLGLGIREEYDEENVLYYYIMKAREDALNVTLIGPDGKPIKPSTPQGPVGPGQGQDNLPRPPKPTVTVTTTEEPVDYDDLTPEEQQEADEQVEEIEQQQDEEWQQQQDHAQEVADDVTTQLHDGDMTPEEAVEALEEAGIDVDDDYLAEMERIRQEEEEARRRAEEEARRANEEEQRRREEEQRRQEEEQRRQREEEEALIQQSQDPQPEQPEQPQQPEQPEQPQQPENPPAIDPEIDPDYTDPEIDEQPVADSASRNLQELRALAEELGDFGIPANDGPVQDGGRSLSRA